jgi:hypothetical protein
MKYRKLERKKRRKKGVNKERERDWVGGAAGYSLYCHHYLRIINDYKTNVLLLYAFFA